MIEILEGRKNQVHEKGQQPFDMACNKPSLAGAVSQRACVFCGSRVVLYPIADALHIVHGPIGCAAYTWDIRGSLSSGPELHRLSFCTDLQEKDVIFGGAEKLYKSLDRTDRLLRAEGGLHLLDVHRGRDRRRRRGRLPPRGGRERHSRAARPLGRIQGHEEGRLPRGVRRHRHAGGHRIDRRHQQAQHQHPRRFQPGRRNVDDPRLLRADRRRGGGHDHRRRPRGRHPPRPRGRAERRAMLRLDGPPGQGHGAEVRHPLPARLLLRHRRHVAGPVRGGRFLRRRRAWSPPPANWSATKWPRSCPSCGAIARPCPAAGPRSTRAGPSRPFRSSARCGRWACRRCSSVRRPATRKTTSCCGELCDEGTILVDDTNPLELSRFVQEKEVDLFIGGVKERPIAFKLGIGFCDHNHERKEALAGFEGMINFAREVYRSVKSPVWKLVPRKRSRRKNESRRHE